MANLIFDLNGPKLWIELNDETFKCLTSRLSKKEVTSHFIDLSRITSPVSKHKEVRTRLWWTISYKSLYFIYLSLELVPLFTGMQERSISFY